MKSQNYQSIHSGFRLNVNHSLMTDQWFLIFNLKFKVNIFKNWNINWNLMRLRNSKVRKLKCLIPKFHQSIREQIYLWVRGQKTPRQARNQVEVVWNWKIHQSLLAQILPISFMVLSEISNAQRFYEAPRKLNVSTPSRL